MGRWQNVTKTPGATIPPSYAPIAERRCPMRPNTWTVSQSMLAGGTESLTVVLICMSLHMRMQGALLILFHRRTHWNLFYKVLAPLFADSSLGFYVSLCTRVHTHTHTLLLFWLGLHLIHLIYTSIWGEMTSHGTESSNSWTQNPFIYLFFCDFLQQHFIVLSVEVLHSFIWCLSRVLFLFLLQ